MANGDSEDRERLDKLLQAGDEPNRSGWALKAREDGKKVVGVTSAYIPEELIIAAGMLPWGITGTYKASLPRAWAHRPTYLNAYYSHVLESVLSDELGFLSAVVCVTSEDDGRRFFDVIEWSKKFGLAFLLFVPLARQPVNVKYFEGWMERMKAALETLGGQKITATSIRQAIELCNETRGLLRSLYELRKEPEPAVSGTEVLRLSLAARVMPKPEFNRELKLVLPYLEKKPRRAAAGLPRLLVSGDNLHDWRYCALIEDDCGAVIAMDDLDTGSRYCWEDCSASGDDPLYSLAQRYLSFPDFAGQGNWDRQIDNVVQWSREFHIDGVVEVMHRGLYSREMRSPYLRRRLEEQGIKFLSVKSDYQFANAGQLATRIGAFVEMLSF